MRFSLSVLSLVVSLSSSWALGTVQPVVPEPPTDYATSFCSKYSYQTISCNRTYHGLDASIRYVTNSSVCEADTVRQHSGYVTHGDGNVRNLFFWFFESRRDPSADPITIFLSGGPGSASSALATLQQFGACRVGGSESEGFYLVTNPTSWHNYSNMLYIDHPVGVGYSYVFLETFQQFRSHRFNLYGISYGGIFGPLLADHILTQNFMIQHGFLNAHPIRLNSLVAVSGWFDASIQYKAVIDFARHNTYEPLITDATHADLMQVFSARVLPGLQRCSRIGSTAQCASSATNEQFLIQQVSQGLGAAAASSDFHDIRQFLKRKKKGLGRPDKFDADDPLEKVFNSPWARDALGAETEFERLGYGEGETYKTFQKLGDASRSVLDSLSHLVSRGIKTLIWSSDADWLCNWMGTLEVARRLEHDGRQQFRNHPAQNYTVDGEAVGHVRTGGNLTWFLQRNTDHSLHGEQAKAVALHVFKQMTDQGALLSTQDGRSRHVTEHKQNNAHDTTTFEEDRAISRRSFVSGIPNLEPSRYEIRVGIRCTVLQRRPVETGIHGGPWGYTVRSFPSINNFTRTTDLQSRLPRPPPPTYHGSMGKWENGSLLVSFPLSSFPSLSRHAAASSSQAGLAAKLLGSAA
ncbi:alpha/beta-hydrolase [Sodiomyces alkalinus F11]|uniref:Alpha/beta-hydrolase n=1 Tax=Sodiomyces alkalinus (strain CBS 110278 / VKM F-3762 / F11) TaxID=1314773 RepID=A0A3N2PVE2_SODAK|nr:alpha/beta-hydrolase [Sodiomyces alkalinus F11]ROT38444.1 alpha/beta-hydrolase [Sodiomyces alkalinus F11]